MHLSSWKLFVAHFTLNSFIFLIFILLPPVLLIYSYHSIMLFAVCHMDDHCCANKHDSLSLSLLTWRSVTGCITTSVIDASSLKSLSMCCLYMFFSKTTCITMPSSVIKKTYFNLFLMTNTQPKLSLPY